MITNFFDRSLSNYWVKIKDTKQLLRAYRGLIGYWLAVIFLGFSWRPAHLRPWVGWLFIGLAVLLICRASQVPSSDLRIMINHHQLMNLTATTNLYHRVGWFPRRTVVTQADFRALKSWRPVRFSYYRSTNRQRQQRTIRAVKQFEQTHHH